MKKRINLYPADMRPKRDPFPLLLVIGIWASVGSIVFGTGYYFEQERDMWREQLEKEKASLKASEDGLTELQKRQAKYAPDEAIVEQRKKMEEELIGKRALLTYLRDKEKREETGYAAMMHDIARLHVPGLWLKEIQIEDKNMRFFGHATSATAVPQWLKNLKGSEHFSGRQFAAMELKEETQDVLSFTISEMPISEEEVVVQ
ncbi:PilN domain-containing protein [Algicola sagamiensis]|uniref:PilN domain-containing protein n=1 Tax=Algicola sagamiensis TaxID=163869 RepID=UPI000375B78F|nr:PilN domain-containing protein [Algicola sagamiensis]